MANTTARVGGDELKVGVIFGAASLALFLGLLLSAVLSPEFARRFVLGELAILESLQAGILAANLLIAFWILAARSDGAPGLRFWLILIIGGLVFILGEEISWGQHYVGWDTVGWFHRNNDQGETNFHNTSSWLDQKPRSLLLLGVLVGGLIHPVVKAVRKGRGLIDRPWWLAPTAASIGPALFVGLGGMPERLAEWGLTPKLHYLRSSEMEELFLYIFMLSYLVSLARNLRNRRT